MDPFHLRDIHKSGSCYVSAEGPEFKFWLGNKKNAATFDCDQSRYEYIQRTCNINYLKEVIRDITLLVIIV